MAIQLLPIIVNVGLFVGRFVLGALSRQPEINELKEQVKSLQAQVEQLQALIYAQNEQIKQLKIRFVAYKGLNFAQKNKAKGYLKGAIIYEYALKEYLEILIDGSNSNKIELNKSEIEFYNAFGKMFVKAEVTTKDRRIVLNYINEKYRREIESFKEPDFALILEQFE